jgi:hypothetical protein
MTLGLRTAPVSASLIQHVYLAPMGRTIRSLKRVLGTIGLLMLVVTVGQPTHAIGDGQTKFKRIQTQFIAALGDPGASSGNGAQSWGLWRVDPGPRGVWLNRYE